MERGEYEAAVRELTRAGELRPDFPEIRAALAEARELWGLEREQRADVAGALEQFQEAVKLDPRAATENHIGVLLAKSGRLDEAVAAFRRALALDPAFANAARNLQQALAIAAGRR